MYQAIQNMLGASNLYTILLRDWLNIKPGFSVLDYGCGCCWIGPHLPEGVRYVGIDPDADRLATAQSKHPNGIFLQGCGLDLPCLPAGTFDLIFSIGVIHHLDDSLARSFWQNSRTILSRHGRVVTVDPVRLPNDNLYFYWLFRLDKGRHIRNVENYISLLSEGWKVCRTLVQNNCLSIPYQHFFLEAIQDSGNPSQI
jgi:SAM-dependent methyltransferase